MSSTTRDTPDNPYRKGDPWGARPTVPQVFTVQAAPAPMRRVFKPAPDASPAAATPRALTPLTRSPQERLHLTPAPEPYDEPPPPRHAAQPASDPVATRRPPFAGAAPVPATERPRTPFVGAAPVAKLEPAKPAAPPTQPAPAPSRLAPFARSDTAPRPTPAPSPAPEVKREQPAPLRPVPLAAIAPPVGGFAPGRASAGRRTGRPLPKGLLVASLLVLAGVAAIGVVVVLKPWASHPSAVDALATQSAKPPAPLTITPAADPFAANATTTQPALAPATTAIASLAPRVGRPAQGASSASPASANPSVTAPAADAAPQPGSAQPAAAAAPPRVAPTPIVVSVPPEMDAKPATATPEPVKVAPPPAKAPASETIPTSHLPGDTVGPHQ